MRLPTLSLALKPAPDFSQRPEGTFSLSIFIAGKSPRCYYPRHRQSPSSPAAHGQTRFPETESAPAPGGTMITSPGNPQQTWVTVSTLHWPLRAAMWGPLLLSRAQGARTGRSSPPSAGSEVSTHRRQRRRVFGFMGSACCHLLFLQVPSLLHHLLGLFRAVQVLVRGPCPHLPSHPPWPGRSSMLASHRCGLPPVSTVPTTREAAPQAEETGPHSARRSGAA